jgi:hypothetical protein
VGKKLGGPEKLVPFPWEAGEKQKAKQKELENNSKAAFAFLTKRNSNGEGRIDDNTEQG